MRARSRLHGRIRRRESGHQRFDAPSPISGNDVAVREDHRALERVLELAHVAGPRVRLENLHRGITDRFLRLGSLLGVPREKGLREQRNIVRAQAKRRQMKRDHVQAVKQVAPEVAALDFLFKIAIGRREDLGT